MVGDDDLPGQWDDELSGWPEERRHLAGKRIAFVTVCGVLITLIFLTIIFVGKDKTSAARVSANGTSTSTVTTVGFATSLPVAATATSFAATTSSSTTSTTFAGRNISTTTTSTTTTAPPPPFQYNPNQKTATGSFSGGTPACYPSGKWIFATPSPGTLRITHENNGATGTGPVRPDGTFGVITATAPGGIAEHFSGTTTQTSAVGTFSSNSCAPQADFTFNLT